MMGKTFRASNAKARIQDSIGGADLVNILTARSGLCWAEVAKS